MSNAAARFLVPTLFTGAFLAACADPAEAPTCPEGTVLVGNQCAPPVELAASDGRTVGEGGGGSGPVDAGATIDAGDAPVALPFFVETFYVMSGFFSENQAATVDRRECSGVSGTKDGATCMELTFSANGDRFGGFFWQFPADNFGAMPGLQIAPGATQVRFRAWGDTGSETVKFGVGIDNDQPNSDGFNVETDVLTLTTEPTEYSIDISGVTYDRVVGAFAWIVEDMDGQGTTRFFIDNIEWTDVQE